MKLWRAPFCFFLLLVSLLLLACSGKSAPAESASGTGSEVYAYVNAAWPVVALLRAGDNALWFELGPSDPLLIESPAAASLVPYTPWPYARFIAGMQVWEGFLVMAVNRDGFFVLGPAGLDSDDVLLYRVSGNGFWDPYTTESFFFWEHKPAVLLYRNDFFIESSAAPLSPQVYTLDWSNPAPVGAAIPALQRFPPGDSWEAEVLWRGPDALWYYRMVEKGKPEGAVTYFRTGDLAVEGVRISVGEYRNSNFPEPAAESGGMGQTLLAALLREALKNGQGAAPAARTVSPDFEGARFFSLASSSREGENFELLYAYCQTTPEPLAMVLLPDGQGLFAGGRITESSAGQNAAANLSPMIRPFSLPALPDGFVYTGAALVGNIIAASWEEQQEAGIGAAGFMVTTIK